MGIEDIQISEELETNAPSIKYSGNEGPKSPQEMEQMMMAQLEEEYSKYVDDMLEQGIEPMSLEQFLDQAMAEGQMSGGNPLPQDPTKPVNPFQPKPTGPVLPDRQMAAYGGIMGMDGRRQYGFGSSLKKKIRNIIPNELADVAVKAAPFVAMIPGQQGTAALMRGLGRFDQRGSISDALKQGAATYGFGKIASPLTSKIPGMGTDYSGLDGIMQFGRDAGNSLQGGYEALKTKLAPAKLNAKSGNDLGLYTKRFPKSTAGTGDASIFESIMSGAKNVVPEAADVASSTNTGGIMEAIRGLIPESTLGKVLLGGGALALGTKLLGSPQEVESAIMERGEGLDIDGIRAEVTEAFKDETGEKLLALRTKYPYLGTQASKNTAIMANGGRIGYADAGAVLSKEQIAMMQNMVKKGMDNSTISTVANVSPEQVQNYIDSLRVKMENKAYGGRIGKAEGGIMDLDGMEKDYRNTGGFVDLGAKEKADDVPARLSVNEFVFTADAVRNAGGGDIDQGAEVMENMMKHLEQGGQVSEESQGMAGARDMFATSQRLSEVI